MTKKAFTGAARCKHCQALLGVARNVHEGDDMEHQRRMAMWNVRRNCEHVKEWPFFDFEVEWTEDNSTTTYETPYDIHYGFAFVGWVSALSEDHALDTVALNVGLTSREQLRNALGYRLNALRLKSITREQTRWTNLQNDCRAALGALRTGSIPLLNINILARVVLFERRLVDANHADGYLVAEPRAAGYCAAPNKFEI